MFNDNRNIFNENTVNANIISGFPIETVPPPQNDYVLKYDASNASLKWGADSTSSDATSIQGKNIGNTASNDQIMVYKSAGDQILWQNQAADDAKSIWGIPINNSFLQDGDIITYNQPMGYWEYQPKDVGSDAESIWARPIENSVAPTNGQVLKYNATLGRWEYDDENPANVYTGTNFGGGFNIFKSVVANDFQFKTITNSDGNLVLSAGADTLGIDWALSVSTVNITATNQVSGNNIYATNILGTNSLETNFLTTNGVANEIQVLKDLDFKIAGKVLSFNYLGQAEDDFEFDYTQNELDLIITDLGGAGEQKNFRVSGEYLGTNYPAILEVDNQSRIFMRHLIPNWNIISGTHVITAQSTTNQLFCQPKDVFMTNYKADITPANNDYLYYDSTAQGWKNWPMKFPVYYFGQSDGNAPNANFFRPGSGMNSDFVRCFVGLPSVPIGLSNVYIIDNLSVSVNTAMTTPGSTSAFTMFKNGVGTTLTTVLNAGTTYSTSVSTITAVPGDRLAVQYLKQTGDNIQVSITWRAYLQRI